MKRSFKITCLFQLMAGEEGTTEISTKGTFTAQPQGMIS